MTSRGGRRIRASCGALLLAAAATTPRVQADGPAAESPLERCRTLADESPDDYRSYACFWATGRATRSLDTAARMMRDLLRERPDNPHVSGYLAAIEMDRGEAESAKRLFRQAADGHARRGWATAEAHVRLTFSFHLAVNMGELDEAEAEIERVRALMDSVTDPGLPTWLALREAMLANARLQFGRALYLLRQIEPTLDAQTPFPLRQLWFSYMGYSLRALDRLEAAYRAYEAEAELLDSVGAPFEEAIPRRNMTLLAMLRGLDRSTCQALAESALETAVRGGHRGMEGQIHRDLSFLSEGEERLRHADQALRIAREIGSPNSIIEALRARALALTETDPAAAVAAAGDAIAVAEEAGVPAQIARSHQVHAEILRSAAPREEAIAAGLAALEMIEATRSLQPDPEIRAAYFGVWTGPYHDLAAYLLGDDPAFGGGRGADPEAIVTAFSVMERMRARTLLDELEAARVASPMPGQGQLVEERRRVRFEIASLQRQLLERSDAEINADDVRARLLALEIEEARLREELARTDPAFAALGEAQTVSLPGLQAALADDQAMLLFQTPRPPVRPTRVNPWLLAVSRTGASVHRLPEAAWIRDAVKLFDGLVDGGDELLAEASTRLYDALLAEALAERGAGVRRLVIVPDGPLHLLPFGALRPTPGGEPLGVTHALTIAPSASIWNRLLQLESTRGERGALVFADPALTIDGSSSERSAGLTTLSVPSALGPLPFARSEAQTVVRRVGRGSRALVGDAASERAFKRSHRDGFAILHLAAHAVVDMDEHTRSGILLAPGAPREDGLLQIRELTDLELDGQLVVLSACRTAGGPVLSSEGVMSLARPFFVAGAATVVASLWPLPDRAAPELFDRFYARLSRGDSVARAMSRARRGAIAAGISPRVWAGVVVLGDGDRAPLAARRGAVTRRLAWGAGVLLSVATLVALLIARRRRRSAPQG